MKQSSIEWTNDTWNPWQGCFKVSDGCKNCYMYRDMKRWDKNPAKVVRSAPATFNAPYHLKGPLVFTCSWSDFFIKQADPWRPQAWKIIRETPHLTYQILTKRAHRIQDCLPSDWGIGYPNVWLGVSVESQEQADERIAPLMNTSARVRFISAEPLLGPIDLTDVLVGREYKNGVVHALRINAFIHHSIPYDGVFDVDLGPIHWVIAGGESGRQNRITDNAWFESLREQCELARVPFFFKQHGGTKKINGHWGGNELSGRVHQDMPPLVQREGITV